MTPDIKRRTELYIVDKLKIAIPTHDFVPFTGGSQTTDAIDIEPPFTVVSITDATRTMATEGTWICVGTLQVVTHRAETTSEAHSELTRSIYAALAAIPSYADASFSFHGIDIADMTSADDDASQAHADIVSFTAGVGG